MITTAPATDIQVGDMVTYVDPDGIELQQVATDTSVDAAGNTVAFEIAVYVGDDMHREFRWVALSDVAVREVRV